MTIFQAIILGIVQGLTEFIPVSSSAHLVLVPWLLGWEFPEEIVFAFDVLVQLGTLAAVFAYFWKDLAAIVRGVLLGLAARRPLGTPEARLGWLVALATLPAGLSLLFKDTVERAFASPAATAAFLLVTAALLAGSEWLAARASASARRLEALTWVDALVIGLMQLLAVFPGVSRSGATIAGGLGRGLQRTEAARFSFLMAVPAMLAAGGVALLDLLELPNFQAYALPVLAACVAAGVVGYLCIGWLLDHLRRRSLYGFAAYCVAAGLACLVIAALR
jgi:undecaprenyl-diphosphatase